MTGKKLKKDTQEKPSGISTVKEAVAFVKEHAKAKFDETVEVHVHLGVDPKQSDQNVRGTVSLPHGSPSSIKVAVFCSDVALQDKAREAGADIVGGIELVNEIAAKKSLAADVAVTTPDMMKDLAKIAKVLGPRGLMPNPKTGTIGNDPAVIVKSLKAGKVSFKMDDSANVHVGIAKASWDADKIVDNARAVIEAIKQSKPSTAKGEYLLSGAISSTMGVGVKVQL
jgi:large subunit ribosomal protein L1